MARGAGWRLCTDRCLLEERVVSGADLRTTALVLSTRGRCSRAGVRARYTRGSGGIVRKVGGDAPVELFFWHFPVVDF